MKKLISIFLVILMLLSAVLTVPVSANTADAKKDGDVLKAVDFVQLYKDKNLTEATDYTLDLPAATGFHAINYQWSKPEDPTAQGSGNRDYKLTENGLLMNVVYRRYAGIVLTDDCYKDLDTYYISMDMVTNCDNDKEYLWAAFNDFAEGTDANVGTYTTAGTDGKRTNFRHANSKVIFNGYAADKDTSALFANEVTKDKITNYTFVVTKGRLSSVILTSEDEVLTFSSEEGIPATGYFGLYLHNAANGLNPGITIRNISIHYGEYIVVRESAGRTPPAEIDRPYTDSDKTDFIKGYVLHNMDFSKVASFDATKYFLSNETFPKTCAVEGGKLKLETEKTPAYVLLTASALPQYILDFTIETTFKMTKTDGASFSIVHSAMLDDAFFATDIGAVTINADGTVSSGWTCTDETALAALVAEMIAGKDVTMTVSVMERFASKVILTSGDKTVTLSKIGGAFSAEGGFMGIAIGKNSAVEVSSIRVISGYYTDYKTLTWPEAEGALVQTVTAGCVKVEQETNPANQETDAPKADATDAPETSATPADTTAGGKDEGKKGGCGASVAGVAVLALFIPAAACLVKSKKED